MSVASNLKDAVQSLDNSHVSLRSALDVYVAAKSGGASDAEVQAAADKVNEIALALQAAALAVKV